MVLTAVVSAVTRAIELASRLVVYQQQNLNAGVGRGSYTEKLINWKGNIYH